MLVKVARGDNVPIWALGLDLSKQQMFLISFGNIIEPQTSIGYNQSLPHLLLFEKTVI